MTADMVVLGPCNAGWGYAFGWRAWRERIRTGHAMHACTGGHRTGVGCTCSCGSTIPPWSPPVATPDPPELFVPGPHPRVPILLTYQDAVHEVLDQVRKLGLEPDLGFPSSVARDLADAVRYVYAQGWLACEAKVTSRDMADQIDLAITTPLAVVERNDNENAHSWTIRAIQEVVTTGARQ